MRGLREVLRFVGLALAVVLLGPGVALTAEEEGE